VESTGARREQPRHCMSSHPHAAIREQGTGGGSRHALEDIRGEQCRTEVAPPSFSSQHGGLALLLFCLVVGLCKQS